jgi:hypothetical protein
LTGSLDRHPCPAALPGSLCLAALPGCLACRSHLPALPGSLARQPCRKVCKLYYGRWPAGMHACSIACFYSAGSLVQAFPAINDIAILSLVYEYTQKIEKEIDLFSGHFKNYYC